jgi:hypothetical protein
MRWRVIVPFMLLVVGCVVAKDHLYDAQGKEIDCGGKSIGECLAAHCLKGETLVWGDIGPRVYRCNP